jgi:FG-GAP-like repeat
MLRFSNFFCFILFFAACKRSQGTQVGPQEDSVRFVKHILTSQFISEGVAVADVNKDGKIDILAGAYWFEAPNWNMHEIDKPLHVDPATGYSNSFLNFAIDVNQDGWVDMIRIGLPGEEAVWYENPGNKSGHWIMHPVLSHCGNESPAFVDINGDGRPDLVCNDPEARQMIWMELPSLPGDTLWKRHIISTGDLGTNRYTHGLGYADMNGDGRSDIIITRGWWERPADPTMPDWTFHPASLGEDCSQMYVLDVNGDGNPDLVTSSAHNYGIWWHERNSTNPYDSIWNHHTIFKEFSQSHAMAMADINRDGHPDIITGKRHFAHNENDPGAFDPSVLYWFESKPGSNPQWVPHLIDNQSGVGLQVVIADMNKDAKSDIVISNKNGVFYFEQK